MSRVVRHTLLGPRLTWLCSLANKGLHVSDKGVSVKTSKRFDREDYVDATQRYVTSSSAKLSSDAYTLQGIHQSAERRIVWTRIIIFPSEHRTIRFQLKPEEEEQTRLACMYYLLSDRLMYVVKSPSSFWLLRIYFLLALASGRPD